ncbi:hypothetical protein [Schleiferilactobacillus perolens]|jgi:hypothetical protein|uniref:Uncharacterized protein n=1 Tax=Schleiferilactobacillus perolens DSM 12744 TaxID=1423792 RepID=A0A0R1MWI9_9LACO|nr:hypothetical protein [Schleiferilactobacillus perolens]KRL12544.1 hypothetical protein FD09_GL002862 [Schleiferilactobacillus perolens DSM 12744]MCI1890945.1 hypothetical protein [Schleiferilactobacillus harbinensis]MCI1911550.1 hypothetical protein [Schleiferilactobacillus harbinensis]MCI2172541.1 hypothetical protein [Schleiferilactobacillus perolens]
MEESIQRIINKIQSTEQNPLFTLFSLPDNEKAELTQLPDGLQRAILLLTAGTVSGNNNAARDDLIGKSVRVDDPKAKTISVFGSYYPFELLDRDPAGDYVIISAEDNELYLLSKSGLQDTWDAEF